MKKTIKSIFLFILVACMLFCTVSCQNGDSADVGSDAVTQTDTDTEKAENDSTPADSENADTGKNDTDDTNDKNEVNVVIKEELKAKTEGQKIDLYLIAGQSNGTGFSKLTNEFYTSDPLFVKGYSNVLYSGNSVSTYENSTIAYYPRVLTICKTKAGYGKTAEYCGPELGMAKALSSYYNADTGRMAGIVKFAAGGTNLSDVTTGRYAAAGNWTPPSYIQKYGAKGSMSGGLYKKFIDQVKTSIAEYEAHGYTVEIKGVFWMQGESDSKLSDITSKYPELFEYLVKDMRSDLGSMVKKDLSALPIVVGEISDAYNITHLPTSNAFVKMQNEMIKDMQNVYTVNSSVFGVGTDGSDASHWTPDDIYYIGQMVGNKFMEVCNIASPSWGASVAALYDSAGTLLGSYSSLAYAINSAPEGAVVKLLSDITLYGNLNINNRNLVTVDGNGHKITSYSNTHGVRLVGCNVKFVNFEFYHKNNGSGAYGIYVYEGAKMIFESGSINASCYGIVVNQDCEITINGGSFTTRTTSSGEYGVLYISYGGSPAPTKKNSSKITINGGTFTAGKNFPAIYVKNNANTTATVTVNGAIFDTTDGTAAIKNDGTYTTVTVNESNVTYK